MMGAGWSQCALSCAPVPYEILISRDGFSLASSFLGITICSIPSLCVALIFSEFTVIGRVKGEYRWHIVLKNSKQADPANTRVRQALKKAAGTQHAAKRLKVTRIVDVDPVGLL